MILLGTHRWNVFQSGSWRPVKSERSNGECSFERTDSEHFHSRISRFYPTVVVRFSLYLRWHLPMIDAPQTGWSKGTWICRNPNVAHDRWAMCERVDRTVVLRSDEWLWDHCWASIGGNSMHKQKKEFRWHISFLSQGCFSFAVLEFSIYLLRQTTNEKSLALNYTFLIIDQTNESTKHWWQQIDLEIDSPREKNHFFWLYRNDTHSEKISLSLARTHLASDKTKSK